MGDLLLLCFFFIIKKLFTQNQILFFGISQELMSAQQKQNPKLHHTFNYRQKQLFNQQSHQQQQIQQNNQTIQHDLIQINKSNKILSEQTPRQQRQSTINSQFEKYQIKQLNRAHKKNQSKNLNLKTSIERNNQFPNKTDTNNTNNSLNTNTIDCYKDWKVYKNKSDLNMLPFPYCFDQSFQSKKGMSSPFDLFHSHKKQKYTGQSLQKPKIEKPLYKLKVVNKVQAYTYNLKQNKNNRPYFNFQKTPINQYLNYDLSQQINSGLREVQIMAQEIKRIKKSKKIDSLNQQMKMKQNKGIRIRKSFVKTNKMLFKTEHNPFRA